MYMYFSPVTQLLPEEQDEKKEIKYFWNQTKHGKQENWSTSVKKMQPITKHDLSTT